MRVELAAPRSRAAAPRTRPDRRARPGTAGPSACRQWCGRIGRRAAAASRCGAAIRSGRRDRREPMSMPSSSDAVATSALQRAVLQPRLGVEPLLLRQAAVVRGDRVVAEPLAQVPRDALGHPPRVDEHQRRPVLFDELGRAGRSTPPRSRATSPLRAATRASRWPRSIVAPVALVDDRAVGCGRRRRPRADEKRGDLLDRLLRRRQADAQQRRARRPPAGARATAPGARRGACR